MCFRKGPGCACLHRGDCDDPGDISEPLGKRTQSLFIQGRHTQPRKGEERRRKDLGGRSVLSWFSGKHLSFHSCSFMSLVCWSGSSPLILLPQVKSALLSFKPSRAQLGRVGWKSHSGLHTALVSTGSEGLTASRAGISTLMRNCPSPTPGSTWP